MTYTYFEFKGKHNRKYCIRRFNNEAYQFKENGKWMFEMKGEVALNEMIADIDRKGGILVKAYSNEEPKVIKTELYREPNGNYYNIEYYNIGRVGIISTSNKLNINFGMELKDFREMTEVYNWDRD